MYKFSFFTDASVMNQDLAKPVLAKSGLREMKKALSLIFMNIFPSCSKYFMSSDILEGGGDTEDDKNSSGAALELLLTGRGPVLDELSVCSVPAGSVTNPHSFFADPNLNIPM